jgi:hypothetical protein
MDKDALEEDEVCLSPGTMVEEELPVIAAL